MENEIVESDKGIRFVPDTLYFTAPNKAWISGQLFMNGKQLGEGTARDFTEEEMIVLNKMVLDASIRHIKNLNY